MRAEELIKGKYYKFMYYGNTYIFKFNMLTNNKKIFLDKCWYIQNDFYFEYEYFYNESYYNFKEIKLSDIIEYLPKNHPDRILFRKQRIEKLLYSK